MEKYSHIYKHIRKTFKENKLKQIFKMIATDHTSPHEIAFGAAMGVFLSVIPTFSLGMFAALFVAWKRSYNLLATYLGTIVINPINSAPVYFFHYKIGSALVGGTTQSFTFPISFELFKEIAFQVYIGGIIVSTIVSILTYILLYVIVHLYRKKT